MKRHLLPHGTTLPRSERGMSLVVVLILLAITMVLGIGAVQLSLMGEKSARNDREYQIAWQASEAGLGDAELDLDATNAGTSSRAAIFASNSALNFFDGCGTEGNTQGLCLPTNSGQPIWLSADLASSKGPGVAYGSFTNRSFAAGNTGLKPREAPRYILELLEDTASSGDASVGREPKYVYRITSLGFGPREDIQAVTQSIYRK